jgi:hypothetical protein
MKKLFYFILLVVLTCIIGCLDDVKTPTENELDEKLNNLVLSELKIGKEFYFKVPSSVGTLEYKVTYLGDIKTSKGDNIKILNNIVLASVGNGSTRASSTVNIYRNNKKIGYYYVGGINDVPKMIEGTFLVFRYNNDKCNQTTKIDFNDSIPHQIFVSCTVEGGDLYTFEGN